MALQPKLHKEQRMQQKVQIISKSGQECNRAKVNAEAAADVSAFICSAAAEINNKRRKVKKVAKGDKLAVIGTKVKAGALEDISVFSASTNVILTAARAANI